MKVRFAPSPTGYFHVGGARTAFYNWMLAKNSSGTFVLRIEDTDSERNKEEWVDGICDALSWLGITWDEGPYRQSQRLHLYLNAANELFENGFAYYCLCSRDEIDARNKEAGSTPGYDGFCRDRGLGTDSGGALRFKVPKPGETRFIDLVRGEVVFDHNHIEDFILVKSSGAPLFVLANVVDDIDMEITHVVRAEEHLPNTPKAILVFQALEKQPPTFGHVPVLVNEKRQKLSKRRDRVAVEDYRRQGIIAPAMLNYLALLGWSPKEDREFMTVSEMVDAFDMANVGHSPSFFDEKKLAHFNGVYIRALDNVEFMELSIPFIEQNPWWTGSKEDLEKFMAVAALAKERVSLLAEVSELIRPIFEEELTFDDGALQKEIKDNPNAPKIFEAVIKALSEADPFEAGTIELAVRSCSSFLDIPLRKLQAPIRVATTGTKVGLPLFETWSTLGKSVVLDRLNAQI
ncbi:glutamate--tRNA ligase [Acidithrix ferrooxidans]|nr:glutamate--tRNA ligase [Acidithrix ferrooxidans]